MSFAGAIVGQRKLILTTVALLATLGVVSWLTMNRQEDPRLPDYFGQVQVVFPGADAETVERLVLEPIEENLAEVDEILRTEATANSELALMQIDLRDDLRDLDSAWDRVREALADARREFPDGVGEPVLNDRLIDTDSVLYALVGDPDPRALSLAAEELKDELLALSGVARVNLVADPGEQITIEYDDAAARRLGLSPGALAAQLGARSRILPGGSLAVGGQTVRLRPRSEFESLDEIRRTAVMLPSGGTVPLEAVARVRLGPEEPERFRARFNGERMVGIGVVPRRGINLVTFGERVRQRVAEIAPRFEPLRIHEIAFQPDRVASRLSSLGRSLLFGALIVAGVLFVFMGPRLGLIVTAVVPLVALSSLAIYNLGGGVLHQISIAALVIALGMLVDNGIVVSEAIQWEIDRGREPEEAAVRSLKQLAVPLAAATATTLAAFVPMLLSRGTTADFTRALPIVIMLTLPVSYLFAMLVTPILSQLMLVPRAGSGRSGFGRLARVVSGVALRRPLTVLASAVGVVALSFLAAGRVQQEFFPGADRNQLLVELQLPEGTHLRTTDAVSRRLELALSEHPEVTDVASFIGRSAPRFYYNINQIPWSSHFGQVVVETTTAAAVDPVVAWARGYARRELPEAQVIVRKLEQGPPVNAPVELRVYGDELDDLSRGVDALLAEVRATPGTADVRHSLSTGAPVLRFRVDDAAAARRGLDRSRVANALYGHVRGLPVGQFRAGDDPIPVVLRAPAGEDLPVADLASIDVTAPGHGPVPLGQVAGVEVEWRPAAIEHYQRRRMATVSSQLEEGYTYSDVIGALSPRLAELELPSGVAVAIGGAAEESDEANAAIVRAVPLGMILLIGVLMAEFRSFRRVGIVLVTVPLAAAGVVPGLLVADQPFGFMSVLGIVALVGVVVNNAIVLLEVVEARRREGIEPREAVRQAIERRLRPILLTTATTVAGLLPLALSPSTLWPPMAWAMISGLTASTLLTLLVVPALYLLLCAPGDALGRGGRRLRRAVAAGGLAVAALFPAAAGGEETPGPDSITLEEAMARAVDRPAVEAAFARAEAARLGAVATRRSGLLPRIAVGGSVLERDRALDLVTPIGSFEFGAARDESAALTLSQPLFDPAVQRYAAPAADSTARAALLAAGRAGEEAAAEAAGVFLSVLAVDAALRSTESFITSLEANLAEAGARVEAGTVLEADALKVRLALTDARQQELVLRQRRRVAVADLARAVGSDRPVEPRWRSLAGEIVVPAAEEAIEEAVSRRADLAALAERLKALELERKAVRAEALPRLEAGAAWTWSSGSAFAQDNWFEGSLHLSWSPFASGTRGPRAAATGREEAALSAELTETRRAVALEVRSALAELETAIGGLAARRVGVEQAAETLRVDQERHRVGRLTTNDLLEAEANLRRQQTLRDVAELDLVRARVRLRLAMGEPIGLRTP